MEFDEDFKDETQNDRECNVWFGDVCGYDGYNSIDPELVAYNTPSAAKISFFRLLTKDDQTQEISFLVQDLKIRVFE